MEEPLRALRRLQAVTGGVAVIESEAIWLSGRLRRPLWQFVNAAHTHDDPTFWWIPTAEGLQAMCDAAGFSRTEIVAGLCTCCQWILERGYPSMKPQLLTIRLGRFFLRVTAKGQMTGQKLVENDA